MHPTISVIIVNDHSEDVLESCLRSLHLATAEAVEVILVDNSPKRGADNVLRKSKLKTFYFTGHEDDGYAAAANLGARHAQGELLCFLHPDVVLGPKSLDRLIDFIRRHRRVAVGPRQFDGDGRIMASAWPFIDRKSVIRSWRSPYGFSLTHRSKHLDEPMQVPVLSSACLVIPKNVWQEVGGWNEELNYVGLESEWFERAVEAGVTNWYVPAAEAHHEAAVSLRRHESWKAHESINADRRWHAKKFGFVTLVVVLLAIWVSGKLRKRPPEIST